MPRFVVLRHEMPAESPRPTHWDLMLEQDQSLRTWALPLEPHLAHGATCEQLPDHRLAYLEYEGPISGDRGTVSRCDAGEYALLNEGPRLLRLEMRGARMRGELSLERGGADDHFWRVSFSAAPTTG